jgi:ABC-type nitrate/sulfonate/bicarbonate transport system substrate-binding protein
MISRRAFIRTALGGCAAGAAGLLGACGGTAAPSAPAATSAAAEASASTSAQAAPATAGSPASASPKTSGLTFSIAYGSPGGFTVPLWLADVNHAFSDVGVTAKVSYIESSAAVSALIAKDVDAILLSAAPVIQADLNGNAGLVFTASVLNRPVFALYAPKSIQTAADVKGKVVASDRPGTPTDFGTRLLLSKLGLKASDVQILPVGGSAQTVAALVSGQAQAAAISPPASFQAEDKGFHPVTDIYEVPYQGIGVVMVKSRLDQLAAATGPFLKGLRRGVQLYGEQPEMAMKLLSQYSKETDETILKRTYDFYKTQAAFEPTLKPTVEGIQSMIDFLAESMPAAKTAKPDQFIDNRFLAQLS